MNSLLKRVFTSESSAKRRLRKEYLQGSVLVLGHITGVNFVLGESALFDSRPDVDSVVVIVDVDDLSGLYVFWFFNLLEEEALDFFVIFGAIWFLDDGFFFLAH